MMDVRQWLAEIGFGSYAGAFAAQDVDFALLTELTDLDLEKLGVTSLGHRKRLLRAIKELQAVAPAAAGAVAAPKSGALAPTHASVAEAERRQLTVMFCDLVGSTALSARLDPEDMRQTIRGYHDVVAAAVATYEGYVAQFLGDGVLVYFGYPRAHEDDASRAVHAGRSVLDAVRGLPPAAGQPLQARIGIATGPVVVAQIGAGTPAAELSATGQTPNLAARLQGLAQPGEIVVATLTRQLIGGRFDLQPLGATAVKGIEQPIEAWRVVGERATSSLFEAQNPDELVRFVGRDSEVSLLLERWAMAREGEGQVLLLSGEAGIGKSRISQTLRERLAAEPQTVVLWQCSPYFGNSALHPVRQWLERVAGIATADPPDARSAKVEYGLARLGATPEPLGHLLRLLGLPDGGRVPADLPAPQQKARTLDALVEVLHRLSQAAPLLCLVEDAHWIDPTTDELLGLAIDRLRDARALVLVTGRPEYTPPWASTVNLTRLPLSRLGHRLSAALVASVAKDKTLPDELVAEIVRKTDGVPLFVGELTRTVLQSGLLVETSKGYALTGPLSALAIPSTLQDSLMARLDRLGAAKEVAQVGAAIGREFPHRLIAEVTGLSPEQLDKRLGALQGAELLFQRGTLPDAVYAFKHALVRDTAYSSMVRSQRALCHGQIAAAIESAQPDLTLSKPELLAYHYQEAGRHDLALDYWERAADLALRRSAGVEATAHLDAALLLASKDPDPAEAAERELSLRLKRGYALFNSLGANARAFVGNAERALDLARVLNRPEHYVNTCVDFAAAKFGEGHIGAVLERVAAIDGQTSTLLPPVSQVRVASLAGVCHMLLGSLRDALSQLQRALDIDDAMPGTHLNPLAGSDPAIFIRAYLSRTRAILGHLEQADSLAAQGFAIALERGHVPSILMAWRPHIRQLLFRGRMHDALSEATRQLELAQRHGVQNRIASAEFYVGLGQIEVGDTDRGAKLMREGFERWWAVMGKNLMTETATSAADALLRTGTVEAARRYIADGFKIQASSDDRLFSSELERLQGWLHELDAEHVAAKRGYECALDIAKRQGALLFELRAAMALASLLGRTGLRQEAVAVLEPVYARFTEGFDFPDLVAARRCLEELRT